MISRLLKKATRNNTNLEVNTPLTTLAPKILTEEKDLKQIRPYLANLKQAIATENINNIALTGSYGSGKSTIIKTFQHQHPEYKYLNISLASFKDNKEQKEANEFERKLEISILQQMFYHVNPSEIPDSRFKRIVNLTPGKLLFPALFFSLWLFSTLILLKFNFIESLNPDNWKLSLPFSWLTFITSIIFFTGIGVLIKEFYRIFKNSKINKLNIKGELELGESIDKSVFNQHIEEILYFFERIKFNVVIIEDVDRFESTDIFTKLREINILINHSKPINRPVKFVYAIKDEMFKDKNERVKFFEFIIPVIPFINPTNANEQLTTLITQANLQNELSSDFTSDVVAFINDIDMRLLINIFQEYQIYKKMVGSELKQDNLFAIIVYKNLYPDDFGALQKREGKLHEFFLNKSAYVKSITEEEMKRIEDINCEIELLEKEIVRPIKELRAIYLIKIVSKFESFFAFHLDGNNITIEQALEDVSFKKIQNSKDFQYTYYARNYNMPNNVGFSSTPRNSSIGFTQIEKEVSNKLTYSQREKLIIDKSNNAINILKSEREKIKQRVTETGTMTIQQLFLETNRERDFGHFQNNNLMRALLLNGYINEYYDDYISLFHEVNLTKEDFLFERKVKSGHSLPFEYSITKFANLIKRLPDHHFRNEEILNYSLLDFLLQHENRYTTKIDYFFKVLSIDGQKRFEFIYGFIKKETDSISLFIQKICTCKPSLWEYILNQSGLPDDEIKYLLKHIFSYADINTILQFGSLDTLDTYIARMDGFFSFCSSLKKDDTIRSYITKQDIRLEELDRPGTNQHSLFEDIYINWYYAINLHNIRIILNEKIDSVNEDRLNTSHYSTLLKLNLPDMLDYIDTNLEYYVENVMIPMESNKEEEENTIVKILNHEEVDQNLKIQLIKSQNASIGILNAINKLDVKQIVLKNKKCAINWTNIFDYYDSTTLDKFDDTLVEFLNQEENYTTLSKQSLKTNGKDEKYIQSFSTLLLFCEELDIKAYAKFVKSVPYTYQNIQFDKLNVDKVEILISQNILGLTAKNVEGLRTKGNNLQVKLIERHQDKFSRTMNELNLVPSDWLAILTSNNIKEQNKLVVIQNIDEAIIINNINITKAFFDILPQNKHIPLSYVVLNAILDTPDAIIKKIAILNLNIASLENNQIQALIEKLGGDFPKIFMKQHKPIFQSESHYITLFDVLKEKSMIIRYEFLNNKKEIKVFANY